MSTCLELGKEPDLADLRLADWVHMRGFRGHFSTRSRNYSTALGDIRADREHHARRRDHHRPPAPVRRRHHPRHQRMAVRRQGPLPR
ncbi:replication initiator [Nonomuraea sp. NPDC003214]